MKLTLPPRVNARPLEVDTAESRQIIIIGANGSGKTRFADRMMTDLGDKAFRMSAIKAIFGKDDENLMPGSIDSLYHQLTDAGLGMIRGDIKGEFDRMIALMLNEEMENLLEFKYRPKATDATDSSLVDGGNRRGNLPTTRIDNLIRLWCKVFPDNRILVESGRMIFSRERSADTYSSSKLSAGERAVLYYIGASMYAPRNGVIFVESPDLLLHPSSTRSLWDGIEQLRSDCTFVYITHDLSFASTRGDGTTVWVKSCDPTRGEWDYDFMTSADGLNDEVFLAIVGARKPVLFIEGDGVNSIDAKLYPLIFRDFTVKSLGGCDRVIESTRTFNSLRAFHNLDACGIVDRDRRDEGEVSYLRKKRIFVPNVAEIENIFMLEDVIRAVARHYHQNEDEVFAKVKKAIMRLFDADLRLQALMHTRHIVKKTVSHRIDGRFANINKLEEHINDLCQSINPRGIYEQYCRDFHRYIAEGDYDSVLRVYNRKTMLSESHVARACGLRHDDKDAYIRAILAILKDDRGPALAIRTAIRATFGIDDADKDTAAES